MSKQITVNQINSDIPLGFQLTGCMLQPAAKTLDLPSHKKSVLL